MVIGKPMDDQLSEWPMSLSRPAALAFMIAALGFLVRLALLQIWGDQNVELFEYEKIADNLLAGRGFGILYMGNWYQTFGSPPFAYVCALVYALFAHSHHAMLVVQALMSMVSVLACYGIGRRIFSPAVGLLAAVLVAFHPALVYFDIHKIHPLGLDASLASLGVLMCLVLRDRASWGVAVVGGFVHGLAIFERSTLIGLVVVALLLLWQRQSTRPADFWRLMAIYSGAIALILFPWFARNVLVYHRPVIVISTTGSEVFWRGNNPVASGGAYAEGQPGVGVFDAAPEEFKRQMLGQDELTQSRIFLDAARAYIFSRPHDALRLYVKKLRNFWWYSAQSGYLYPPFYLRLYQGYYMLVLIMALVGMWRAVGDQKREQADGWVGVVVFMLSVSLAQAAFYVDGRHRWSIEPVLLIFTASGLIWMFHRFSLFMACPRRPDNS